MRELPKSIMYTLQSIVRGSARLTAFRPWERGKNRHYRQCMRTHAHLYGLANARHQTGDKRTWAWDTQEEAQRVEKCLWNHRAGQRSNQYEAEAIKMLRQRLPPDYIVKHSCRTKRDALSIPYVKSNFEYDIVVFHNGQPIAFVEIDGPQHFFPNKRVSQQQNQIVWLQKQLQRDDIKNKYWSTVSYFARIPVMCFQCPDELRQHIDNIIWAIFWETKGLYMARPDMYKQARITYRTHM